MQEYSTRALILSVEQVGERDGRVILYTEALGKVVARAKSLFAVHSKLAGHVQPLTLARVRLVEKKGIQLVDALAEGRLLGPASSVTEASELLSVARLIEEMTAPGHADSNLWKLIEDGKLLHRDCLRTLGFDPEHARCNRCNGVSPKYFLIRDEIYLCKNCFSLLRGPALGVKLGA